MKGYINIRLTPIGVDKIERALAHDYRRKKNINHIDYEKSKENYQSHSEQATRALISKYKEEHRRLYLKRYARNLRPQYTHSIRMGVITFPAHYQAHYENGDITKEQLLEMFKDFQIRYEEYTGAKILSHVWHFDEKTFHAHFFASNFNTTTGTTTPSKNAEVESHFQDLGGAAFAPIGLERGISKNKTKAEHNPKRREHFNQILNQADTIEHYLDKPDTTIETIEALIKGAVKPLKTMLTYVKRALKKEQEADKIIQNQRRALDKLKEALPNVQNIEGFNELVDYIIANKSGLHAQGFKPKRR